jgi:nicotinate-nucleotide adenylyltransferase
LLNYLKKKKIKIGILGGSFDPAHVGHVKISTEAKKKYKLKYILWLITEKNPFKKECKYSIKERIKFSKIIANNKKFIKIQFLETKIKSKKTIDLIKFIKKINSSAKIYFIMGADNLINFHRWKRWKEILKLCEILVFDRRGYKFKSLKSKAARHMNKNNWKFIKFNKINISSSQIRKI